MAVIGIDLGTTNSVAAFVNADGKVEVIANREGARTTPSVVAYKDDEVLVGLPAIEAESMYPQQVVRSIKRKMGTSERLNINNKEYSPEEISADILIKIKQDVEAYLGEIVTDAIITVPAYFDHNQRVSTMTAGKLAGMNVLRVINEPTAASIAYGLDRNEDETILVYDLGGGTFDVTILNLDASGVFEVKSTAGDTALGGDDIDELIVKHFVKQIQEENPEVDCNAPEVYARLRDAAEKTKKQLSFAQHYTTSIPYLWNGWHFQCKMFRHELNTLIQPLIQKTIDCINMALKDASMSAIDIDKIVLVGGSTRIPYISETIQELTGKIPNKGVNPDEAVAIGAALQADNISGGQAKKMLLIDVTPLSLGVETYGQIMSVMIPRNTPIPCERTERFTTYEDNQKRVIIGVYQGERPKVIYNKKLDEYTLDIEPAPRGVPQIDVTFCIDVNSITTLKAVDMLTGKTIEATVQGTSSLSDDEIQSLIADAERHKHDDEIEAEYTNAQAVVLALIMQIEVMLSQNVDALTPELINELKEQKQVLTDNQETKNIEMLSSIQHQADAVIKKAGDAIQKWAEAQVKK